jgi:3-oxoacyl-(acyl-carrier-protein) synthase
MHGVNNEQIRPLAILSAGCVTSVGKSPDALCASVRCGRPPQPEFLEIPGLDRKGVVYCVPPDEALGGGFPRLRRSGAISLLACEAAKRALAAGPPIDLARCAVLFATANGAASYTRRFYAGVVADGTGSPVLFPETVYNAPASHIAALAGIDGEVLTLTGDATAATDALLLASQWIGDGTAETCLVVAAEELDELTWEAYNCWGLVKSDASAGRGAVLSEGAIALLLGNAESDRPAIRRIHPGTTCHRGQRISHAIGQVVNDLCTGRDPSLVVSSASGTRFDLVESKIVRERLPRTPVLKPKLVTGESLTVSVLAQTIVAQDRISSGEAASALVPVTGWNGRVGGLILTHGETDG